MGLINQTYTDRVKYELWHEDFGTIVINEPKGWKTDEKEIARNKKYHGIFTKFSNSLKFIGNGADRISLIRDIYGINADVRLARFERNGQTDLWDKSYDGYLDISTYKKDGNNVSVKFNTSGLEKMIKARGGEKVEIERLDTIDGEILEELETERIQIDGRRILLRSKFETSELENSIRLEVYSNDGNVRSNLESVPMKLIERSHEHAHSIIIDTEHSQDNASTGDMMLAVVDRERMFRIKFDLSFKYWIDKRQYIDTSFFKVCLTKYKNGTLYNNPERIELLNIDGGWTYQNHIFNINYDNDITLLEGESLALEFYINADFKHNLLHRQRYYIECREIESTLTITENSYFHATSSKLVLAKELGERLLQIITKKSVKLKSEALGRTDNGYNIDSKYSLLGFSHGHWIRGFDKQPNDEENRYKYFTTSFNDYLKNIISTLNLGFGIERNGYNEVAIIEDLKYFYNNNVTIKLPNQVSKIKRSEASELYYSGLKFGYSKGGNYEEAMGLDEYNVKSTFTTVINRVKKTYNKISNYRADSYGLEFARRKPKLDNPTLDTSYDKDIFILDLKRYLSGYKQRLWQDDFEQEPTGVFSPETATNLRYSPFNTLLRHGWVFASGLTKYLSNYVKYGSSESNSNLTTKLIGGIEYSENGDIINSELKRPLFVNEWIEFEHIVGYEIMKQVEGTTIINGKKIFNFYGLIEFINENNNKEFGYLFNLKPNGSGKWKLLKANR